MKFRKLMDWFSNKGGSITLIELMVVLAIVGLLIAILVGALNKLP